MAVPIEPILLRLLVPESDTITQATNELKEAFKDPNIISSLATAIATSDNAQIRQFATLLLRQRFKARETWDACSKEIKYGIKMTIVQGLLANNTKLVKLALAQLAGVISSHQEEWPELFQLIDECLRSDAEDMVELGTFTLSILCQTSEDRYEKELSMLLRLFKEILEKKMNKVIFYNVIQSLVPLAALIGSEEMPLMQKIVPQILKITRSLQAEDEDKVCSVFELLDELMDSEVPIMSPYVKDVIRMCLDLISNKATTDSVKIRCLHSLDCIVRLKPKIMKKSKLHVTTINVIFDVMSLPLEDDDEADDEMEGAYASSPQKAAGQVLDSMARNFPPKEVVEPLLLAVQKAVFGNDTFSKKAAFDALSMISDGCAEYLKANFSVPLLELVGQGLNSSDPIIVRAAMYSLGVFSQYLQPNVKEYASQFVDVFIKYLATVSRGNEEMMDYKRDISRLFYAFTNFCENMDEYVVPYLPVIMEQLFMLLSCTKSVQIIDLVIQTFGSLAESAKQNMEPYFNQIMECMKPYLTGQLPEQQLQLQIQAIATLSILARKMSRKHFTPLAKDCFLVGLNNVAGLKDPDLKRSIFRMFSSIVYVLKEDSAEYLELMLHPILLSLQSTEGLEPYHEIVGDDSMSFDIEKLSSWNLSNEEIQSCLVTTSYVEEKEDALDAVKEIAESAPTSFGPYLTQLLSPVYTFTQSDYDDISKSALLAYGRLCCTLSKNPTEESLKMQKCCVSEFYPVLVKNVEECRKHEVVASSLEAMGMLLNEITETGVWQREWLEEIVRLAFKVMHKQVACQHSDDDAEDEDEDDAEYDILLFELAADLIPSMVKFISPAEFDKCFQKYLALMLSKSNKKRTNAERSFGIGMLARCCENMKIATRPYVAKLYPAFMTGLHDSDYEVRSNAVYGLGVLLEHTDELLVNEYPTILREVSLLLANEKDSPRVVDNACATISRMILTNSAKVPMDMVFPSLIAKLPLKEDYDENEIVFKCILFLLQEGNKPFHALVLKHANSILEACAHVLQHEHIAESAKPFVDSVRELLETNFRDAEKQMTS